jgi:hypothetical protein
MSSVGPTNREAGIPGLTPSETKLIALGVAFTKGDGKVCIPSTFSSFHDLSSSFSTSSTVPFFV